jgi:hypothetical protein
VAASGARFGEPGIAHGLGIAIGNTGLGTVSMNVGTFILFVRIRIQNKVGTGNNRLGITGMNVGTL